MFVTGKNINEFDITINNKCKSDVLTFDTTGVSNAIEVYSGYQRFVNAVPFTHTATGTCATYVQKLVEVSDDNGVNWHSSGTVYTDLLASENTELRLTISPKTSTFDGGVNARTRKIRISVRNPYSEQGITAANEFIYDVTINPKALLVDKVNKDLFDATIILNIPHANLIYTVSNSMIYSAKSDITVKAPSIDGIENL